MSAPSARSRFVEGIPPSDAATLLHLMSHDDRAHLVNRLDDDHADEILRNLAQAERDDIRRLASYEPGTGGAVMTTDYATLPPGSSVKEALDRLRREAPDRETIDYSYVVDADHKLLGVVPLKRLILARPLSKVAEIMQRDVISARVDEDQEAVARKVDKYDLFAIPILDAADKLVGIVTHDDAMDILRQEQTEDILAFGGVAAGSDDDEEENYWQGKVQSSVKRRIGWLLLLFLGGSITQWVIHSFEWVDKLFPKIEFDTFIPLLIGTGGNAGSQSVGTIIRGLALNQIQPGDTLRVVAREMLTGLVLGLLIGFVGYLYTWLWLRESSTFGLVIGLFHSGNLRLGQRDRGFGPALGTQDRYRPGVGLSPDDQYPGRCDWSRDFLSDRHHSVDQTCSDGAIVNRHASFGGHPIFFSQQVLASRS